GLEVAEGLVTIAPGGNAELRLRGRSVSGESAALAARDGGTLHVDARVSALCNVNGTLEPQNASVDLTATLTELPAALLGVLGDAGVRAGAALGDRFSLDAKASGNMSALDAALSLRSSGATAEAALALDATSLRAVSPIRATLAKDRLFAAAPELAHTAGADAAQRVTHAPEVEIVIDELDVPRTSSGGFDLETTSFAATMRTGVTDGVITIPESAGGRTVAFNLAPASFSVISSALGGGVELEAHATGEFDNHPAGTLDVSLLVLGVLDDDGAPTSGLPEGITGTIALRDAAWGILQPMVDDLGVRLDRDVGPTISLELRANSALTRAAAGAAGVRSDLSMSVRAENLTADANASFDAGVLRVEAITASLATTAPALTRVLADHGIDVAAGAGVELALRDVRIDANPLGDQAIDADEQFRHVLESASGHATLRVSPTTATIEVPGEARPRELRLGELVVDAETSSLAQRVDASVRGGASYEGAAPGEISAQLAIMHPLDALAVRGRASLSRIPTAPIPLPPDVRNHLGPELSIEIEALDGADPSDTRLNWSIAAERLNGVGAVEVHPNEIVQVGDPATITIRDAGPLLSAVSPSARATGGELALTIQDVRAPLPFDASGLRVRARGDLTNLSLALASSPDAPPTAFTVESLGVQVNAAPRQITRISSRGRAASSAGPVVLAIDAQGAPFADVLANAQPASIIREMTLRLTDLPADLLAIVPGDGPALAALARDAIGPRASAQIDVKPEGASNLAAAISGSLQGSRGRAEFAGRVDRAELRLDRMEAGAKLSQAAVGALAKILDMPEASLPRVSGDAELTASLSPGVIMLAGDPADRFARAGDLSLTARATLALPPVDLSASSENQSDASAPSSGGGDPSTTRLASLPELHDAALTASIPLRALGASRQRMRGSFEASLADASGDAGHLSATIDGLIEHARPIERFGIDAKFTAIAPRVIDPFMPELSAIPPAPSANDESSTLPTTLAVATEALGGPLDLTASLVLRPQPGAPLLDARTTLDLTLSSPRLSTPQPVQVALLPDRVRLRAPATIDWTMAPRLGEALLFPGAPPTTAPRLTSPARWTLAASTLELALGGPPLRPDVFLADLVLTSDRVELVAPPAERFTIRDWRTTISAKRAEPGVVRLTHSVARDDGQGGTVTASIASLTDEKGNLTPDRATLTAKGRLPAAPVSALDALADQGGLLVEALGATARIEIDAKDLNDNSGSLRATLESPRASIVIDGVNREGRFEAGPDTTARVVEITPELSARLVKGLPLAGTFSKTTKDAPASVTTETLMIPVDGDFSMLSGVIRIDPGEVGFETSRVFGTVLKAIKQREQGTLGRKLEPITIRADKGVLTYDKFRLPLGEFTVEVEGSVDLVQKVIDVVMWIPVGALTDEASGTLNSGLGKFLGVIPTFEYLTMVPVRAKGPLSSPSVAPDAELFAKKLPSRLRPDRVIERGVGDILDIFRPKNTQPKQPSGD
ncbi:MAG: hypothetical protein RBS39_10455, partial [Phycisphaerales bacterium]|nr:hypothetical protein [Phycisphaerales bacterium]